MENIMSKLSENLFDKFSMDFLRNQVLKNAYGNDDTIIAALDPRILIAWYLFFGVVPWFVSDLPFLLGSFLLALFRKEFGAKGGSSPLTRFVLGMFVMIGCLMFLGCPFRMILRLAGGDWNALFGLAGFVCGILVGVFFLNRGYSLHRSYRLPRTEGILFPALMAALLVLLVGAPALLRFTESGGGPGAQHAAVALSLAAGLVVGALAQHTRLCMVGGIRDMILFRESKLLLGFVAVFASALVCNLILTAVTAGTYFNPGFTGQAVAHTDGVWNFLGMLLAGYGCHHGAGTDGRCRHGPQLRPGLQR